MSTQTNKAAVLRYYDEVLNAGNIDLLDELAVGAYDEHDPLPGQTDGREGLKQRVRLLRDAFAPRFSIDDLIADEDKVAVRWTNRGTHVGAFLGLAPTGRSFAIAGVDIHRLEEGRLAEHWHVVDLFSLMEQLAPGPAEAAV
jgi:steroid delta-isomerase-like uncharacterized protein